MGSNNFEKRKLENKAKKPGMELLILMTDTISRPLVWRRDSEKCSTPNGPLRKRKTKRSRPKSGNGKRKSVSPPSKKITSSKHRKNPNFSADFFKTSAFSLTSNHILFSISKKIVTLLKQLIGREFFRNRPWRENSSINRPKDKPFCPIN